MPTQPRRTVRWRFSAQQYGALNTVDSRAASPDAARPKPKTVSPPPPPPRGDESAPKVSIYTVPPTPRIPYASLPPDDTLANNATASLPASSSPSPLAVLIHPALAVGSPACLSLDISFPTAHFRNNPQLKDLGPNLDAPASNPALSEIKIHVEVAGKTFDFVIEPKAGDKQLYGSADGRKYVTIGRVLGDVQAYFRKEWEEEITEEVPRYFQRRCETVNGADRPDEDEREKRRKIEDEGRRGIRKIDLLLGNTLFMGFSAQAIDEWVLHLRVPERYAQLPESPTSR